MLDINSQKILFFTCLTIFTPIIHAYSFINDARLTKHEQKSGVIMQQTDGVSGLPNSQDKIFYSLDEYLAHLVEMGKQDRPFYELISSDKYKLNVGRGGQFLQPQYFTRQELMIKFGFSK